MDGRTVPTGLGIDSGGRELQVHVELATAVRCSREYTRGPTDLSTSTYDFGSTTTTNTSSRAGWDWLLCVTGHRYKDLDFI